MASGARIKSNASKITKACRFCQQICNIKGLSSHERACSKRIADARRTLDFNLRQQRDLLANAPSIIRRADEAIARARQDDAKDVPPVRDSPVRDVIMEDIGHISDNDQPQSPVAGATDLEREPPPIDPMTGEEITDAIKIVYHPNSGREPEILSYHDYIHQRKASTPPTDKQPWNPFRTRADFEFAEVVLAGALNAKQRSVLIALVNQIARGELNFTLKDDADLTKCWKLASTKLTAFTKKSIKVPFLKEERTFVVYYRPVWDWALDLIRDSRVVSHFTWDAQRLYKYHKESGSYVRFYDEPWTGNRFWEIQSNLVPGMTDGKPFSLVFYADKNKLSSFGTQKGYPVIVRCANLPVEIRNGEGIGGGMIVGWLPVVPENAGDSNKPSFADFKAAVWHRAVGLILNSIETLSKIGHWVKCGDNVNRQVFPIILVISADYEEQCVIALNRGPKGKQGCNVCHVPSVEMADLKKDYPLRTAESSQNDYLVAKNQRTFAEREKILKPKGLRPVQSAFWALSHSDPHRALSWDRLHAYQIGLFAGHIWPIFRGLADDLGRKVESKIDNRFKAFPIWRGLYHFESVLTLTFNDGKKHEDLSKQLLFVIHDIFRCDQNSPGYVLLRLLRSFLVLDVYMAFNVHTDHTIAAARRELENFNDILNEYILLTKRLYEEEKKAEEEQERAEEEADDNAEVGESEDNEQIDNDGDEPDEDEQNEEERDEEERDEEERDEEERSEDERDEDERDEEERDEEGRDEEERDEEERSEDELDEDERDEDERDEDERDEDERDEDERDEDERDEDERDEEERDEDERSEEFEGGEENDIEDDEEEDDEEEDDSDDNEDEEDEEDDDEEDDEDDDDDNNEDEDEENEERVAARRAKEALSKKKKKKKKKKKGLKNWNFPKAHSHKHALDDVVDKGVTRNYNTKPNEKLHGPLRNIYHRHTNFRNVAPQILNISHITLVGTHIRGQLNVIDRMMEKEAERLLENPITSSRKCKPSFPLNDKYYLGSPANDPIKLRDLEVSKASDPAFKDFRKRLSAFFNNYFRVFQVAPPGDRYLRLSADHEITEFKFLKVNYESKVTWRIETDFLRCNPRFFKKERYDFVIVKTVRQFIFARLIFLFSISVGEVPYALALIQGFDAYLGPPRRRDSELGLWRVGMRPRATSEIISISSIERGAILVQDTEFKKENEYIVMDILDGDMYLRVKEMRGML